MAIKTQANPASVDQFIASLEDTQQQLDSRQLVKLMQDITGQPPVMWGSSIIGFDTYHYKYASGQEGDWMKIGFSPRKGKISLYLTGDADSLLEKFPNLGKTKSGKGCIYINRLADVDHDQLVDLVKLAYQQTSSC